jgi:hypothetical protein
MTEYIEGLLGKWQAAVAAWHDDETEDDDTVIAILDAGDELASALSASLSDERAELAAARERIEVLEVALRPFADGCLVQIGPKWDLRDPPDPDCCRYCAARAALGGKK